MPPQVLVVDDHPAYRESFCQLLRVCIPSAQISEAGDGSAALRLIQEHPYDLLIVDYQLPGLSGSDIIRRLRARSFAGGRELPPIVLMSSQPDAAIFARSLGVAAFLAKPSDLADLRETLLPLLERSAEVVGGKPRLWRI